MINVPVKSKEKTKIWIDVPLLDPHRLVHYLFSKAGMHMDPGIVKSFWQRKRAAGETWATRSPAGEHHIPIALYGDGAALYSNRPTGNVKMLGLFLSFPLWRCYSTRCSRFCIFCIEEHKLWGCDTLDRVLQRVVYSCNVLFDDSAGLGRHFTVTEIRGDWQFFKQVFAFSSSWTSLKNVCYLCTASGDTFDESKLFYNYWDDNPNWQEYSLLEFINKQQSHRLRVCVKAELVCFALMPFDMMHLIRLRPNSFAHGPDKMCFVCV